MRPGVVRWRVRWIVRRLRSLIARGDSVECPVCGGHFRYFLRFKSRQGAKCPKCGALDRHRAMWLILTKGHLLEDSPRLLHFAPEECLERRLRGVAGLDYRTADLSRTDVDLRLDVTSISLPDGSVDALLCSHVLEHVTDDRNAMKELRRILSPFGWALIDVPIDWSLSETFEDWTVTTPVARARVFGQWDHVRLYGRNFADLLRETGWSVSVPGFSPRETERFGLPPSLPFVCVPQR
jgi:SAM-dependent methyltransferase